MDERDQIIVNIAINGLGRIRCITLKIVREAKKIIEKVANVSA